MSQTCLTDRQSGPCAVVTERERPDVSTGAYGAQVSNNSSPTARPPLWRTLLAGVLCAFASMVSVVFSAWGHPADNGIAVLLMLVALAAPVALGWRHRAPLALTLAAAVLAVALPVGTSVALALLLSLFARRSGVSVWWATAAVTAATALTFTRDVLAPTAAQSFLQTLVLPADAPPDASVEVNWWVVPMATVLTVGPVVGIALIRRANRRTQAATSADSAAGEGSQRLGGELGRQQERERIAREVHDVLGHRLSLLNLHAGALQVRPGADPDEVQSAELVRQSAAQSMEDLRSLLDMLHEPSGQGTVVAEPSLEDLPAMIEETAATGISVTSSVYLDQAATADPAVARAVYRVVQELLTNARKHAHGMPIRLSVTGGPQTGITIDARNRYVPSSSASGGRGLQGIAERVELLQGQLGYGLDDGGATFRVTVLLPWRY